MTLAVDVPALPEYVGLVRMLVSNLVGVHYDIDDDRLDDLGLAVSEACTLAVGAGRIVLRCTEEEGGMAIEVHGVDVPRSAPAGLPDPHDMDVDASYGYRLMRALVDDVSIERGADGDRLRLFITLPRADD